MSFAAGVLVPVSFMHIIPKSFELNDRLSLFLLAGFLMLYLSNRFPNLYICLLAASAGALLYVGASHLLPEVEKENRRSSLIALAAGVLVAVAIVMSKQ